MSPAANRRGQPGLKVVNMDTAALAIAKAVYTGNIVNFRFLFLPFSPARQDSSERFDDPKYDYLLPDASMQAAREFQEVLKAVRERDTWRHIEHELQEKRPAQLPSELLIRLADYAVRAGRYTSAAQAYELLRIRSRMQEEFWDAADAALDANDILTAVRGYLIATGLAYDYAAFPEPLPDVPDFQVRALALHGDYPEKPENCVPLQPQDHFLRTALSYLLLSPEAAARLESRPVETREAFLVELVNRRDPDWPAFAARYREACALAHDLGTRITVDGREQAQEEQSALAEELASERREDPRRVAARLLGREIPEAEWWQYLKELAYEHPPAALFVCRQIAGDEEILIPLYQPDSPVTAKLGLLPQ